MGAVQPPLAGRDVGFVAYVNDMNSPTQHDPTASGLFVRDASENPSQFEILILESQIR